MKRYLLVIVIFFIGCTNNKSVVKDQAVILTPQINYAVKASFPHSTNSFTQGLTFHKGVLYESTGSPIDFPETESVIGILDLKNGEITEKVRLDRSNYFGEGIVFLDNKVFQLTYKNQICFVYDDSTFTRLGQYRFTNKEGWGLTTDGKQVIMSDGTHVLSYIDPKNFKTTSTISVTENGYAVQYLNELEYIEGFIYANIWLKNEIIKIDPSNGDVIGKLDLTNLKERALQINANAQETNGIAYDPATNRLLVTGKLWPTIYEIELAEDK